MTTSILEPDHPSAAGRPTRGARGFAGGLLLVAAGACVSPSPAPGAVAVEPSFSGSEPEHEAERLRFLSPLPQAPVVSREDEVLPDGPVQLPYPIPRFEAPPPFEELPPVVEEVVVPPEAIGPQGPPPTPAGPPQIPRYLRLDLPLAATVHVGGDEIRGRIEDLILDGARIAALLVAVPNGEGRAHRRLVGGRGLWWRAVSGEGADVHLGFETPWQEARGPFDVGNLFDGGKIVRLEGEMTEHEHLDMQTTILKVHDDRNLVHRVLIEPGALVMRANAGISAGDRVAVQGVETRDGTGKLVVASAFGPPTGLIRLRDERGEILWQELTKAPGSARALAQLGELRTVDGATLPVTGLALDGESEQVFLVARVGGTERLVPMSEMVDAPGGGWGMRLALDDASKLPALPEG